MLKNEDPHFHVLQINFKHVSFTEKQWNSKEILVRITVFSESGVLTSFTRKLSSSLDVSRGLINFIETMSYTDNPLYMLQYKSFLAPKEVFFNLRPKS